MSAKYTGIPAGQDRSHTDNSFRPAHSASARLFGIPAGQDRSHTTLPDGALARGSAVPTAMGQAVHLGLSARAGGTERDPDGMHDDGAGVAAGGLDHPPRARAKAAAAAWTKGMGPRTRLSTDSSDDSLHRHLCSDPRRPGSPMPASENIKSELASNPGRNEPTQVEPERRMSIGDLVGVIQATRPADAQVQQGVSQQRARETTATQGGVHSPALSTLQLARLDRQLQKVAHDLAAARDLQINSPIPT